MMMVMMMMMIAIITTISTITIKATRKEKGRGSFIGQTFINVVPTTVKRVVKFFQKWNSNRYSDAILFVNNVISPK